MSAPIWRYKAMIFFHFQVYGRFLKKNAIYERAWVDQIKIIFKYVKKKTHKKKKQTHTKKKKNTKKKQTKKHTHKKTRNISAPNLNGRYRK